MFFGIIAARILFVACMVFIVGYIFGSFSKSAALRKITKVATVLAIVLFFSTTILAFRSGGWRHGYFGNHHECGYYQDSTIKK